MPPSLLLNGGQSPRAVFDGAELLVFHGVRPNQLDADSDVLLLRTFGQLGGAFATEQFNESNVGGYVGAAAGPPLTVFTRRYSRSALFGAEDALYMFRGRGYDTTRLELSGSQGQRHRYRYLSAAHDAFGLPVLAYLDERAAFFGDPAEAPTCIYRPTDADQDGLPDEVEPQFGTRVDDADTDGDGRTDGQEVLVDGTDPTVPDGCDPSPETCNGIDDDCDDATDEGLQRDCYPGPQGSEGVGPCRGGTQTCDDGDWGACDGAVVPDEEACNGADDDCDRATDEGDPGGGSGCATGGEGVCGIGVLRCRGGDFACEPVAAADDEVCDAQDNDCDGETDEGRRGCGVGACFREVDVCVNGRPNPCVPGQPAAADAFCDNTDDDCDGTTDEDFERLPTGCGVGACERAGERACVQGIVTDTCAPGEPNLNDAICDGRDEDCDAVTDEDFLERNSRCGVGACEAQGRVRCVGGDVVDNCVPGQGGPDDDCDGTDDDCDGLADEHFVEVQTECGLGECAATGAVRCVGGVEVDSCRPGPAEAADLVCDTRDEDCDGATDEDYAPRDTTCGVGACGAQGRTFCEAGTVGDDCVPGEGADDDPSCDGADDDCDRATDEDYAPVATECGVGACVNAGATGCEDGAVVDGCEPRPAAPNDAACDGVDSDCDGATDEDARPRPVTCGIGACRRDGEARCEDGDPVTDCVPGQPGGADDDCDGTDDDCDGAADEDFVEEATACGSGVCAAQGQLRCVNGGELDTCVPGDPGDPDDDCDGVDDNCNGTADENYQPPRTTCGTGGCAATGRLECRDGAPFDTCVENPGADDDESCNGFDDDCDERIDEDYEVIGVACGFGACLVVGERLCLDGELVTDCEEAGGATDDPTCDRVDDDCDGETDEDFLGEPTVCGLGACAAVGASTCVDGELGDTCNPGIPAPRDDDCDGVDDDCDGSADEDYAGEPTVCGVGACVADGVTVCVDGELRDSCVPAEGGGADDDCDGVDDDCDGGADEDFVADATACGTGVCAAAGETRCVDGRQIDTCEPGPRQGSDSACDGIDADCDGATDERYRRRVTRCGVGACAETGRTSCVDGEEVDDCEPGEGGGADEDCDGIDEDCDGTADEGYVATPTECGLGVCVAQGVRRCVNGNERDTCRPGQPAANDTACDGRDEDCDGETDEGYDRRLTRCGRGACEAGGLTSCVDGRVMDDCEPGEPAAADASCDGIDDDCDGAYDEDHAAAVTACGQGACVAEGASVCVSGALRDTCVPGRPSVRDARCDGIDEDCDGRMDEDYQPRPLSCGVGACLSEGFTRCVDGVEADACVPGEPGPDVNCNARDEDCDGSSDEGFVPRPIECGVGACQREGEVICRPGRGRTRSTCRPGTPAVTDATCDGVDDDCDGANDEDYVERRRRCGVGACNTSGRVRCTGGEVVSGCRPLDPAPDDGTCDGVDDDCDGANDEDFVPARSTCGVGACQAQGEVECRDGRVADTCVPDLPSPADVTCDTVDDDCDQRLDEDFPTRPTACGVGACAAAGQLRCDGGELRDSCRPGDAAPLDDVCDARDEDCDGAADEEYAPRIVGCGVGACAAEVMSACVGGVDEALCVPGAPTGADDDCDGIDQDCDGVADEGFEGAPTACGTGACAAAGVLRCEGAAVVDTCEEGAPAEDDVTCDGVDDDCDDAVDEHCPDGGAPDGAVVPDASAADAAAPDGEAPDGPADAGPGDARRPVDGGDAAVGGDGAANDGLVADGRLPDAAGDGPTADGATDGPSGDGSARADFRFDPVDDGGITGDFGGSEGHDERDGGADISGSGFDCGCRGTGRPGAAWALLLTLAGVRRRRR